MGRGGGGHPAHAFSAWTSGKSVDAKTDDCAKVHSDGAVADTLEVNLFGRLDLTFRNNSKSEKLTKKPADLPPEITRKQ